MPLAALASGALLRALWLAAGLWRLRRYRIESDLLYPLPEAVEAARLRVGADAIVLVSDATTGPVTFGFLRPVILLPGRFRDLTQEAQHAIACHEFLHVRRRDWLVTVCEEATGVLLWFHPAIWWLLSQIRLAREQVVDREVVTLTESGQPYVDALLAMAGARPQLDLAPAPLFLRKRHLAQRLHSLLQEVSMSKARLISSYALMSLLLALTGWFTLSSFPLQGPPEVKGPPGLDPSGVTVDPGGKLLHRPPVSYPYSSRQKGIQGVVVLELSLDANGTVLDARVSSGPPELRKGALESALQWHYLADGSSTRQASIDFRVPPAPASPGVVTTGLPQEILEQTIGTLDKIDYSALPEPLRVMLQSRLATYEGKVLSNALMSEISRAAVMAEPHLSIRWQKEPGTDKFSLTLLLRDSEMPRVPAPMRVRVGGNVQSSMLESRTAPVYPPAAKEARIQGTVKLNAVIGKDGHVRNVTVESGHPLLVPAALEAVREWVYKPTLLNGQPVEVVTTIDVNFTLSQ